MKDFGTTCRDVRTREVGVNEVKNRIRPNEVELVRRDYVANGGWETFLAYEDPKQDILIALLRLRRCSRVEDSTGYNENNDDGNGNGKGEEGDGSGESGKIIGAADTDLPPSTSTQATKLSTQSTPSSSSTKPTSTTFRPELTGQPTSLIRELHVYGSAVPLHARNPRKFQHQGYGTLLMEEAERIARDEHGSKKIAVISGVGVRSYYRKLGYTLEGVYMCKMLRKEEGEDSDDEYGV